MSETIGQSKTPKRSRFTNMPQSRLQTAAPLNSDDVMPSVTQPVQPPVQPASLQRSEASRKGDAAGQGSEATEKRETSQPASPVLPAPDRRNPGRLPGNHHNRRQKRQMSRSRR